MEKLKKVSALWENSCKGSPEMDRKKKKKREISGNLSLNCCWEKEKILNANSWSPQQIKTSVNNSSTISLCYVGFELDVSVQATSYATQVSSSQTFPFTCSRHQKPYVKISCHCLGGGFGGERLLIQKHMNYSAAVKLVQIYSISLH